jgi:hypothetical protein
VNVEAGPRGLRPKCWEEGRQAEQGAGSQQYGEGVKKTVGAERRSDLKEEASNLNQSGVAAKDTREWEREIGTKWNYH